MKVLITGGCGFIGTNLIPYLSDHDVVIVDNLSQSVYVDKFHGHCEFYNADIRDEAKMRQIFLETKPDIVFHFAGLVSIYDCHRNPHSATTNNIVGSVNVFNAAIEFMDIPRVIFSESSAVYENCELLNSGFGEWQSDPTTFYSTSKACVALIAESLARTRGLKYTALRYFNVAGPIQDYKRTVPPLFAGVALRLLGGNNPIIFGDGNRARDFIHVDDVNAFHLQCMKDWRTIGETFNLGLSRSISLFQVSHIIHEYLECEGDLEFDILPEIAGEADDIFANTIKAREIGWTPEKTVNDAIYDTIDYLKKEIELGNVDPKTFMNDIDTDSVKI